MKKLLGILIAVAFVASAAVVSAEEAAAPAAPATIKCEVTSAEGKKEVKEVSAEECKKLNGTEEKAE